MNTTTLNMTTLDGGNVIIKKEAAPAPPSSGESGGSNWRYFDCEQVPIEGRVEILTEIQAMLIKAQSLSYNTITSSASIGYIEEPSAIVAFGADMSIEVNVSGEFTTLGKLYETIVDMLAQAGFVEITKEQFYTLD